MFWGRNRKQTYFFLGLKSYGPWSEGSPCDHGQRQHQLHRR